MFDSAVYKAVSVTCHTVYIAISARKRLQPTEALAVEGAGKPKRTAPLAEIHTCNFLIEAESQSSILIGSCTSRLLHQRKQYSTRICGILSYPVLPPHGRVWRIKV